MGATIAALETRGLVERTPDPDDGRATIARITPAGEAAFRATAPTYLAKIDEHFNAHLTDRERVVIAQALQRLIDAHGRIAFGLFGPKGFARSIACAMASRASS